MLRWRSGADDVPAFAVLSVYRSRHVELIDELCRAAAEAGATIRLWNLDGGGAPGSLEAWTVGSGSGDRPVLLNRLERTLPAGFDGWVVIADDDITIRGTDLATFVALAVAAGLDIAQPAHSARSQHSYPHTLARPFAIARRTEFVEVGPMVAFSPLARPHVFPIDETYLMGLGAEFAWMDLRRLGIELGIVDCVTVCHVSPPGSEYGGSRSDLRSRIEAAGGPTRMRIIHGVWYPTRAHPPWIDPADGRDTTDA